MIITLIRHGRTQGNIERQYIGSTDQPLAPSGVDDISARVNAGIYPAADRVYVSPMLRCVQTAGIIYPGHELIKVPDLRECSFGIFEAKTHDVLIENSDYVQFLESGGNYAFPGGDSFEGFVARCVTAFQGIMDEIIDSGCGACSVVCHGGSIMSIMSSVCQPQKSYYEWQVANGCGYSVTLNGDRTVSLAGVIE